MYSSDFCFRMGSTHSVCQDYAVAGVKSGAAYAMVADGCSGLPTGEPGSPFTDFGARYLTRSAQRYLAEIATGTFPAVSIVTEAAAMARFACLPVTALDSTLIVANQLGNGTVVVHQTGDGVIAARLRNGAFEYRSLEFDGNMPFYLRYALSRADTELYLSRVKGVTVQTGTRDDDGWICSETAAELSHAAFVRSAWFNPADYDLVLIMTDGALSFQCGAQPVPLGSVLDQLFAFKGFAGQFVARRCGAFLGKFCRENGWTHADDFSVAGIYLGDSP